MELLIITKNQDSFQNIRMGSIFHVVYSVYVNRETKHGEGHDQINSFYVVEKRNSPLCIPNLGFRDSELY